MTDTSLQARVVIIGGGVVGCSALYHLARRGWTDCLLLEKNELTSGSTWHAAGNCPSFSGSWSIMKMQHYSTGLYGELGQRVGYPIDYHRTGSIRLAHSRNRMEEYAHVHSMARYQGLQMELMDCAAMRAAYPYLQTHDLQGGLWDPSDGDIDPAQLTQALAKGARDLGARVIRHRPVTSVDRTPSGEWSLGTPQGQVRCEFVVNAAGYRAAEVGRLFGRDVPCVAMAHQYLVTEQIRELAERTTRLPLLRDPDASYYLRQEGKGLLLGPYEWEARAHWVGAEDPMPEDFSFQLFPDDLDRLGWYIEDACKRVPILASAGVQKVINGPIPYTPDGNPLIGPMPGVPGAFEACVFSFGITQAGGAGKVLAEWIIDGEPEWDMWSVDPRRFTEFATPAYTRAKAVELYQREYAIGYPHEERPAGRPGKVSPLYQTLAAKGAVFGARAGWERACWFAAPAQNRVDHRLSFHHTHWFEAVAEECRAVAETVGVCDLPGFARFEVSGPGAARWLRKLITGPLPQVGRIGLAYFATPRGRVLTEMTVTRFDTDRFWLIGSAAAEWHDRDWLLEHLPRDGRIRVENLTPRWGTLLVAGPRSRELLERVYEADFGNRAFPWLSHRSLSAGSAEGLAIRMSYTGELGWELHLPTDQLEAVYQSLWAAGDNLGLRDVGIYALDSLRIEKGYRAWKQDLSTEYTMTAAGLAGFVDPGEEDFIGREALLAESSAGPSERFAALLVAPGSADAPCLSTVWLGEQRVGLVTSGGYGHRLGQSVALAIVRADLAVAGTELEIEILGRRRAARVGEEALYDPEHLRARG